MAVRSGAPCWHGPARTRRGSTCPPPVPTPGCPSGPRLGRDVESVGPADNCADYGSPTPAIAWSHGQAGRIAGERRTRGDEGPARLVGTAARGSPPASPNGPGEPNGSDDGDLVDGPRAAAPPMAETCQRGRVAPAASRDCPGTDCPGWPESRSGGGWKGAYGRPASAPSADGTASAHEPGAQAARRAHAGQRDARHRQAAVGRVVRQKRAVDHTRGDGGRDGTDGGGHATARSGPDGLVARSGR